MKHPEKVYEIKENVLFKSKNDKPELQLLWLEKCYKETLKQEIATYKRENIDMIINEIHMLAKQGVFDEKKLINIFNKNGIALVIQEDIPGSKIRGAFTVHKDPPAIYITKKNRRLGDIYFALLHELAHCKTDFNKAKSTSFISLEKELEQETKRDDQAFDWMIPEIY